MKIVIELQKFASLADAASLMNEAEEFSDKKIVKEVRLEE